MIKNYIFGWQFLQTPTYEFNSKFGYLTEIYWEGVIQKKKNETEFFQLTPSHKKIFFLQIVIG